jgi:SPP1 gp7 family putative phage head morphogenesis protein
VADLKVAYSKFNVSEGTSNRYTIESQTARYRELTKAAEGLMGPGSLKNIQAIYENDLNDAYSLGTSASRDLAKVVDGASTSASAKISKMPIAAQAAAGQNLMQFWTKEKAALTAKVTEATLSALQRGKGWAAAQRDIAQALRSDGQTILRGRDELSVTARNGIVMNLEQRADLIAKTELANAYIQGQMAQYRKNGYTHGRWSATGERSCPFCVAREGNIYTLDELEGAIPAHPRCRCTVAPVLEENVKNVQNATDKEAAAALNLDDAGWTAIRQQRFSEFQKFTGKPMSDPAKYINTPTNRQKYLNPQAKGTPPAWMPSGKAMPDLNSAQAAAGRAAEQAKQNASEELTAEEKIVNDVMNDKRFKSDSQRTREMRARLGEAGLSKDLDFVEVAGRARDKLSGKGTAKDLEAQKAEAKKAEDLKKTDAKKVEAEAKAKFEKEQADIKKAKAEVEKAKKALADEKAKQAQERNDALAKQAKAADAAAKKLADTQYTAVSKAFGKSSKGTIDRAKFDALPAGDKARLYDAAVKQLVETVEAPKPKTVEKPGNRMSRDLDDIGKNGGGYTKTEKDFALKRAEKYVADGMSEIQATFRAAEDVRPQQAARLKTERDAMTSKVKGVSKTFKADEHFVTQQQSKLVAKDVDDMFKLMEAQGGLVKENAIKLQKFLNHHHEVIYFSNASLNPKGYNAKTAKKLEAKWDEARNSDAWIRAGKRAQAAIDNNVLAPETSTGKTAADNAANFLAASGKSDHFTAGRYNANKKSGGYTIQGTSIVVIKDNAGYKPVKKADMDDLGKSYADALEDAAANNGGSKKQLTAEDSFRRAYSSGKRELSSGWANTLIHELGHQVHFKGGQKNMSGRVTDSFSNRAADSVSVDGAIFPSKYATVNNFEQFAENFTTYMLAPDTLKRLSPKTYDWIDSHMRNALEFKYDS